MFDEFPQLETETLILREIHLADAKDIFMLYSDSEVVKYHDMEVFKNIERTEKLINRWGDRFQEQQAIRWGIAKKTDNVIIGTCGYSWQRIAFCAEVGYELAKAHWRQGIMTEALNAMMDFGFEKMELNRIQAMVMLGNTPSMNLLKKIGFKEEGLLRDYGFWKGNLKMFSLLRKDRYR
jgi:[ribosomal protein S5]-alanine N-acetyltransferase